MFQGKNEAGHISIRVHRDDFWLKELCLEVWKFFLIVSDGSLDVSGARNNRRTPKRRNDHTLD